MKITNDGMSLWYGTPDAPAPLDAVVPRGAASLVVGVSPPNPTNSVQVRYRVDGGFTQSVPGREIRTDHARQAQYFAVDFPPISSGRVVEFCPVFSCGGRQVPSPPADSRFPAKFLLPSPAMGADTTPGGNESQEGRQRFALDLTYLGAMKVRFIEPQVVGETPEGVRFNYYAKDGHVVGPKLVARLLPGAADHLFVRPDGVGVIRVRATLATNDGAVLETEYTGSLELGPDGYAQAVKGNLPRLLPLVICPRVLTGHPKYLWLNRLQCLGIGVVNLSASEMNYDLFAVNPPPPSAAPRGRT